MSMVSLIPSLLVSLLLSWFLWRFPLSRLLDKPSHRSLHHDVIPRSGGIAILVALGLGIGMNYQELQEMISPVVILAMVLLCITSLWDDISSLPQYKRLMMHGLIAVLIVFVEQMFFDPNWLLPTLSYQLLTIVAMIWMINLYNFMDGMDGFAAGMAIMGFSTLAWLGYLQGDSAYGMLNMMIVVAVGGFWYWNFPPAKIFMGDAGSTSLGLLVGLSSLWGIQHRLFPFWVPLVVFSPFWIDATYTLFRRIARGERFWLAHRSHFYQRLVMSGLGHRPVVLMEYSLMLACSLSVTLPLIMGLDYNCLIPWGWCGIYFLLIPMLEKRLSGRPDVYSSQGGELKK